VGLSDLGRPEGYLQRQVRGWIERYYGSKTHDYPEVEKISAWMQQCMPSTSVVSLIHNDYKYDNVVLDSSDVTSIIGVSIGRCAPSVTLFSDLGTALAYWVDATDPEELQQNRWDPQPIPAALQGKNSYSTTREKRGAMLPRSLSISLSRVSKLAVIVQQIYFRYRQGLTKDERFASMPERIQILLAPLCTARKLDKSSAYFSIQIRVRHSCSQFQMDHK